MSAGHTWLVGIDGISECTACGLLRRPDAAGRAWTYARGRGAKHWDCAATACADVLPAAAPSDALVRSTAIHAHLEARS